MKSFDVSITQNFETDSPHVKQTQTFNSVPTLSLSLSLSLTHLWRFPLNGRIMGGFGGTMKKGIGTVFAFGWGFLSFSQQLHSIPNYCIGVHGWDLLEYFQPKGRCYTRRGQIHNTET